MTLINRKKFVMKKKKRNWFNFVLYYFYESVIILVKMNKAQQYCLVMESKNAIAF